MTETLNACLSTMDEEGAPEMVAMRRARVEETAKVFMMDTSKNAEMKCVSGVKSEEKVFFLSIFSISSWERSRCVMKRKKL